MKKVLTSLFVITLIAAVFTGTIFAHNSQRQMRDYNENHHYNSETRDYNRIELNQEQLNQIADLRDDFYNQTEKLQAQIRDLKYELRNLEFRGASNKEIGEIEDQLEELLVEMDQKRAEHQQKIESVLTDEQLDLLAENRSQYQENYQRRFKDDYNRSTDNRMFLGHHNGFGPDMMGMMGWGFSGNRNGNRYHQGYGSGPGWCH
ncbi:MAG: Spy/CpxP family protein refolding chaperone [Bacillota bacterium]